MVAEKESGDIVNIEWCQHTTRQTEKALWQSETMCSMLLGGLGHAPPGKFEKMDTRRMDLVRVLASSMTISLHVVS